MTAILSSSNPSTQQMVKDTLTTPKNLIKQFIDPVEKVVSEIYLKQLAHIVSQYEVDPQLSNWYFALESLGILPKELPPLTNKIIDILRERCPFFGHQKKQDGSFKTIGDTHILVFMPDEPNTLIQLEQVLKPYGECNYSKENNPLQFRRFEDYSRVKYGDAQFKPGHWELVLRYIIPDSRGKSYQQQVKMVESVSKRTGVQYEVPSLQAMTSAIFLNNVATGETLYPAGDDQNNYLYTYTRVKEKSGEHQVAVGGFSPNGLGIIADADNEHTGITASRPL